MLSQSQETKKVPIAQVEQKHSEKSARPPINGNEQCARMEWTCAVCAVPAMSSRFNVERHVWYVVSL